MNLQPMNIIIAFIHMKPHHVNYHLIIKKNGIIIQRDIIINVVKSQIPDGFGGMKDTIAYNITDSGNKKPLSEDVEKANGWLTDPKTWKDVYSNKTADYLELVVNGKIPVYNKELGKYVEKTESDAQAQKVQEEAATEILQQNYNTSPQKPNEIVNNDVSVNDDVELPF